MMEIAVHEIRDGQVLADDVSCSETGQVLLAAGATLKRSHVELLERRGVLTVRIVEAEKPESAGEAGGEEDNAPARDEFAEAISRLEHMFEGLDDDPIMRALHTVARGMVESAKRGEGGE